MRDEDIEIFYISSDGEDSRASEAMFDGPGWYWWTGKMRGVGDVEGPYETRNIAIRRIFMGW